MERPDTKPFETPKQTQQLYMLPQHRLDMVLDGQSGKSDYALQEDDISLEYVGFGLMPSFANSVDRERPLSTPSLEQTKQRGNELLQSDGTALGSPEAIRSPRQALLAAVEKYFFMPSLDTRTDIINHVQSRNSSGTTITPKIYPHDSVPTESHDSLARSRSSFTSTSLYGYQPSNISRKTYHNCKEHAVPDDIRNESSYHLQPVYYTPGMYDETYPRNTHNMVNEITVDTNYAQWSNTPAIVHAQVPSQSQSDEAYYSHLSDPGAHSASCTLGRGDSSFRVSFQDVRVTGLHDISPCYPSERVGDSAMSGISLPFQDKKAQTIRKRTEKARPTRDVSGTRNLNCFNQKSSYEARSFIIATRNIPCKTGPEATFTTENLAEAVSVGPLESIVLSPSSSGITFSAKLTFVAEKDATTFWNLVTGTYNETNSRALRTGAQHFESSNSQRMNGVPHLLSKGGADQTAITHKDSSKFEGELLIHGRPATVSKIKIEKDSQPEPNNVRIGWSEHASRILVLDYKFCASKRATSAQLLDDGELASPKEPVMLHARAEQTGVIPEMKALHKSSDEISHGFPGESILRNSIEQILQRPSGSRTHSSKLSPSKAITKLIIDTTDDLSSSHEASIQSVGVRKTWADTIEEQENLKNDFTTEDRLVRDRKSNAESDDRGLNRNSRGDARGISVVVNFAEVAHAIRVKQELTKLPEYQNDFTISYGKERLITPEQLREQSMAG